MKKTYYLLIVFILAPFITDAQRWKAERISFVFGTGMSQFMGDLGGGSKNAAHFLGVRDLDFSSTRPSFFAGFRYRITEELSFEPTFSYIRLSGKDAASASIGRKSRNLSFRSNVLDFGGQFEYAFIKEKQNPRYSFSSLRAMRNLSLFAIVGGGYFKYNPQAEYNGKWYDLRPLHTEGQGQAAYTYTYTDADKVVHTEEFTPPAEYKKFAAELKIGLGVKFSLSPRWAIGLEITNNYTTTDYLDDAHDRYYNYTQLGTTPPSPMSLIFSDRHLNMETLAPEGQYDSGKPMRGDPKYKDAYILTLVTAHYKIRNTVRGLPKF